MRRAVLTVAAALVLLCSGVPSVQGASPPPPPSWVSTVPGYITYVWVNWAYVSSATSYSVYRESPSARIKTYIGSTVNRQWNDETAVPGVTYTYWVKSCNGYGCSDYSVSATGSRPAVPDPPGNVVASDGLWTGFVGVKWDDSPGSDYYVLFAREQGASSGTSQTASTAQAIHYPEKTGIVYEYRVAACVDGPDGYACSAQSAPDTGWAAGSAPAAPANVQASDGTHVGKVVVTFGLVPNAIFYSVWSAETPSQPVNSLGLSYSGVFEDTTAPPGDIRYYWVYACNMDDCSAAGTDSGYARAAPTATATRTNVPSTATPTRTNIPSTATPTATAMPGATTTPAASATPGSSPTPRPTWAMTHTLYLPLVYRR